VDPLAVPRYSCGDCPEVDSVSATLWTGPWGPTLCAIFLFPPQKLTNQSSSPSNNGTSVSNKPPPKSPRPRTASIPKKLANKTSRSGTLPSTSGHNIVSQPSSAPPTSKKQAPIVKTANLPKRVSIQMFHRKVKGKTRPVHFARFSVFSSNPLKLTRKTTCQTCQTWCSVCCNLLHVC
jgi:hypothetical protein